MYDDALYKGYIETTTQIRDWGGNVEFEDLVFGYAERFEYRFLQIGRDMA